MPNPISWSDVSDVASELALTTQGGQLPPAAALMILAFVNSNGINTAVFDGEAGDKTFAARVLLAAHYATMVLRKGVGGVITSQSEGEAAQAYMIPWKNPSALDLTSYGQMLRGMAGGTPARAGLIAGGGWAWPWG